MTENNFNRRDFIKLSAVGLAVAAGTRIIQEAGASGAAKGEHQWVMVIDQSKCTGCDQCNLACHAHNDINPELQWTKVLDAGELNGEKVYLPRPCMQCEHAPCVEVCPVGASYYRDDGIVMMDYDKCIGCRYCMVACPYDARVFNWKEFTRKTPPCPNGANPRWIVVRAVCRRNVPSATTVSIAACLLVSSLVWMRKQPRPAWSPARRALAFSAI
ncbi:4Fe-4S dicluster domain-containing protein [Candidatus Villigracilis affinis]|uniref:4Fe-4S dicluster domain-containing protein n=1 Tax=Candidatus Villigracilis affinis TaxID=3140682 RepID=UPI002A1985BD|nr:4Fe-4S binding protein [Anaerolineales bacterium]